MPAEVKGPQKLLHTHTRAVYTLQPKHTCTHVFTSCDLVFSKLIPQWKWYVETPSLFIAKYLLQHPMGIL